MLSKCANPACDARFRYLHQGRIFNIEVKGAPPGENLQHRDRIEHFWLCESCARVFKVVWVNGAMAIRLRYLALTDGKSPQTAKKNEAA